MAAATGQCADAPNGSTNARPRLSDEASDATVALAFQRRFGFCITDYEANQAFHHRHGHRRRQDRADRTARAHLRERGVNAAALKPVCSGSRDDARVFRAALAARSRSTKSIRGISMRPLRRLAARRENKRVTLRRGAGVHPRDAKAV